MKRFKQLGVIADMQPVWLYLDARTLSDHFGYERCPISSRCTILFEAGAIAGRRVRSHAEDRRSPGDQLL